MLIVFFRESERGAANGGYDGTSGQFACRDQLVQRLHPTLDPGLSPLAAATIAI